MKPGGWKGLAQTALWQSWQAIVDLVQPCNGMCGGRRLFDESVVGYMNGTGMNWKKLCGEEEKEGY